MQKKVTLKNSIHNTQVNVFIPQAFASADAKTVYEWFKRHAAGRNSPPALRERLSRIKKKLCGSKDCKCPVVMSVEPFVYKRNKK